MKIISVQSLDIPDVKVVRFARFCDARGYFTESFRKSDFNGQPEMAFMKGQEFVQVNESFSHSGVVRGLHFQWNPYMGKLVRTVRGRMVDMFLDVRKGSPTFGKGLFYDMPAGIDRDYNEWIWIPAGFAHGNFFTEESQIEYFCTGEYSQGCEAGISPISEDIDWSMADSALRDEFRKISGTTSLMTEKDRSGFTLEAWLKDKQSDNFIYGKC